MIQRIIEKAKKENREVCVYAHKFPDGDAISSARAIVKYLEDQGIRASYIVTTPVKSYLRIVGEIPLTKKVDKRSISLIVDTSTLDYAENKLFLNTPLQDTFVIDHHRKEKGMVCIEEQLGLPEENVLRDSSASSTCEILLNAFDRKIISPTIADMLTLGLVSDTAKLKFLQPNTLKNLQTLLQCKANYRKIISMCTRKRNLKEEVGMAEILLHAQRFAIGDTFGIILPVSNEKVNSMNSQYGLRAIQKKIFKMANLSDCSFICMSAENAPGEFDLEFRSSLIYGNFDVQQLAAMYGGGGHHNASGCHLSLKAGYTEEVINSAITKYATDTYAKQAVRTKPIVLTEEDVKLKEILDGTERLTNGVNIGVLSRVDELRKSGANYDYIFETYKTFERFMLENEVLSKIPCSVYNQRQPVVNISLSPLDVKELKQKHGVDEEDILGLIDVFSNINIQSASISLPNDRNVTIDANGTITCKQTNIEEKEEQSPMI